eukprot:TCALIF_13919-PA protein Name:"Protein of unknown function" AED:0.21 eAED:0.21 QI:242/1/0.5/1/1/1/2/0/132
MQRLRLTQSFVVVISALLFLSHISESYVVNSAGYWPTSRDDVEPASVSSPEEFSPPLAEEEPAYPLCPTHPSCWQNVFKYPAMAAVILQAIQNGQVVQQRQSRSLGSGQRRFHSAFDRFSKKSRFGTVRRKF